jgi:hypothetical protein
LETYWAYAARSQTPADASAMGTHEGQHCPGNVVDADPGGHDTVPQRTPAHGSDTAQTGQHSPCSKTDCVPGAHAGVVPQGAVHDAPPAPACGACPPVAAPPCPPAAPVDPPRALPPSWTNAGEKSPLLAPQPVTAPGPLTRLTRLTSMLSKHCAFGRETVNATKVMRFADGRVRQRKPPKRSLLTS